MIHRLIDMEFKNSLSNFIQVQQHLDNSCKTVQVRLLLDLYLKIFIIAFFFVKIKEMPSLLKILSLNKPEWLFILIGSFASIVTGIGNPLSYVFFSKFIGVRSLNLTFLNVKIVLSTLF